MLQAKATADSKTPSGETPLHVAAEAGQAGPIAALVDSGANVNAMTTRHLTPLLMAADRGHGPAVAALLSHGAGTDATTKEGHTAMWLAVRGGHGSAVAALAAKVNPNGRPAELKGLSWLEFAAQVSIFVCLYIGVSVRVC